MPRLVFSRLAVVLLLPAMGAACKGSTTGLVPPPPPPPAVSISISPPTATINVGATSSFNVSVTGGSPAATLASCTSSSSAVATVVQNGNMCVATGVSAGPSSITATASSGQTAQAQLTVAALPDALGTLTVAPSPVTVVVGLGVSLTPNANPASTGVTVSYAYESNAPGIATVSETGVISGVAPGSASVTVTATGSGSAFTTVTRTATVPITVVAAPDALGALEISPQTVSVAPGETAALTPDANPASPDVTVTFTYESAAPAIASVSEAGVITGVASGNTTITVTAEGAGTGFSPVTRTVEVPVTVTVTVPAGGWVEVTQGNAHTCGRRTNDAIYCWGQNFYGQLGDGTTTNRSAPVPIVTPPGVTFVQLAAGHDFTCARATTDALYCWGRNDGGPLGDGTTSHRPVPTLVTGGHLFAQVAAGGSHACGRTTAGAIRCWGSNGSFQLGDGTSTTRTAPTPIIGVPPGTVFTQVSVAQGYSCGRADTGSIWCWGDNAYGNLGIGNADFPTVPTLVQTPVGVTFETIEAGLSHSCSRSSASDFYCWGRNHLRQLGVDGGLQDRVAPTLVTALPAGMTFSVIKSGGWYSCALSAAGALYCWGYNLDGALGVGGTGNRNDPTLVTVPPGTLFAGVSGGNNHTCGWTTAGDLYCWGNNQVGQIGDGTVSPNRTVPTKVLVPGPVDTSIHR